jgi:hypothetical protein
LITPGGAPAAGTRLIVPVPLFKPGQTEVDETVINPGADVIKVKLTLDRQFCVLTYVRL